MNEEQKKEPDYRGQIRKRAEQSSTLRQQSYEKLETKISFNARDLENLRQKIEMERSKKEGRKE